jgi:hypothetical protein
MQSSNFKPENMDAPINEPDVCKIWHMDTRIAEQVDRLSKVQLRQIVDILSDYNRQQRDLKLEANKLITEVINKAI